MLHEALDAAVKERLLAKNPTNGTTVPKCNYPEKQILGDNQLETFLEAIKGHEYARHVLILSISLDTFSTQNSKQVRNQLFEMEQIYMERSGMDICSISVAA